jgi:hypothetical protein
VQQPVELRYDWRRGSSCLISPPPASSSCGRRRLFRADTIKAPGPSVIHISESSLVLHLRIFSCRLPPHSTSRGIASDKALSLEELLVSPAYAIKLSTKEPIHIPDRYQIVVSSSLAAF